MAINTTHIFTAMLACPGGTAGVCLPSPTVLHADVNRYEHAAAFGGVYHDDDATLVVPPRHWHTRFPKLPWAAADLVIGVEFPRPAGRGPPGCCLQFVQWAFGARAGTGLMADVARQARANARGDVRDAVELTGPAMFTRVVLAHIGHSFNLAAVEASGSAYASAKTGELVIVLPYRAFGIHPAHRGPHIRTTPTRQQLVRHGFRGRWRAKRSHRESNSDHMLQRHAVAP
jgi:hypothetical protein